MSSSYTKPELGGSPPYHPSIARKYLEEDIYTMSPVQLLVKVYDIAIDACQRQDKRLASKALVELISALNFEYEEIAGRFFQLYKFCMSRVKAGKFDEARKVLQDLRNAWVEASKMNAVESHPSSPPPIQPSLQVHA
jgi:flagellin-specific chaperone FliS